MAQHVLKNEHWEVAVALVFIALGCFLLWDSYDNRGKQLPWFARWFSFW